MHDTPVSVDFRQPRGDRRATERRASEGTFGISSGRHSQGRFCLHAMHAIEFENFFSWFSTKFDLFSMILNQTQLIRNTHSIWPSASKKLKNYRKLQFILENIGFCDGLERGSRA